MGTQFGVDLVFKAVGGDKIGREIKKIDVAANRVSRNVSEKIQKGFARAGDAVQPFVNKVQRGFRKINASVERTKRSLKGVGGALTGIGAGFLAKQVVGDAAGFGQTQVRLKALSEEYGEFNDIQIAVKENTELFNQSQREAAAAFADSYARLRPFGFALEEIDTIYKGFNATAIANGASAEAASNAFLQLSQALGAGALQGDEFRSIAEQVPGLLGLVADEMGVTVGQLKKLGSEGRITAEILLNSLAKGFEKNKDLIQQIIDESPEQQFQEFSNSVSNLSDAVGTELLPVATSLADAGTELVNVYGKLPGVFKSLTSLAFGMGAAFLAASAAAKLLGFNLKIIAGLGAKVALVAAPIIGLGLAFQDAKDKKKEFDNAMSSDSLKVVNGQIDLLKGRAESLRQTLELTKNANPYRGQIGDVKRLQDELRKVEDQLIDLTRRRELFIDVFVRYPDQPGSAFLTQPGFSDQLAEELKALGYDYTPGKEVTPLKKKKGRSGGGGRGRSAPTDDIAGLERSLKLMQELEPLQDQLRAAQAAGNEIEIQRTQFLIDHKELLKDQADILANLNTEEGKRLQGLINAAEEQELIKQLYADEAELIAAQAEARENALQPLLDQQELLEARLNGFEDEVKLRQQARDIARDIVGLDEAEVLAILEKNTALEQQAQQYEEIKNKVMELSGSIASELTGALTSIIDGSKSAEEAMTDALEGIGKAFIDMAMKIIQEQLTMIMYGMIMKALGVTMPGTGTFGSQGTQIQNDFGSFFRGATSGTAGLPKFADGGSPPVGQMSIVGERGPELFIPNQSGRIVSNESMANYMPNGGGGGGGSVMVNYSGPQLNFNGDEYLPKSSVNEIINQAALKGAKLGEARTVNSMRNNRTTRTRAGI